MSNSKWDEFKSWFFNLVAKLIPETSKRFILYELQHRAIRRNTNWNDDCDDWKITFEQMYETLTD
jgi:hypothetical protein